MSLESHITQDRKVIRLEVRGGAPSVRDSLSWRLPMGIPDCHLVAADATGDYELLLSEEASADAEVIRARIDRMVARLNEFHPSDVPLRIAVVAEPAHPAVKLASA